MSRYICVLGAVLASFLPIVSCSNRGSDQADTHGLDVTNDGVARSSDADGWLADGQVTSDVALDSSAGDGEARADTPAQCENGEASCSSDGMVLTTCVDGQLVDIKCMAEFGKLCENGECVLPWKYGDPKFEKCYEVVDGTTETLRQKADYYDEIAARLHIHPQLKFITHVTLPSLESECPEGQSGPCYKPQPSPELASPQDVVQWHTGENDGLWSALYLASQAYRYAVTAEPQVLETLRVLMEGELIRSRITGVPGLFTRQYIAPGIPGISCPDNDDAYVPDVEKDDNKWVKIKDDGCVWIVDRETKQWTATSHCGLEEFAGWCWLDNVSQDEYAGHIFALGAVFKLVDDQEIRSTAATLLSEVATHLRINNLTFVDWDGRITEHGYYYATCLRDTPGFAAVEALEHVLAGAVAGNDQANWDYYNNCLLQKAGPSLCIPWPFEQPVPYTEYLDDMAMYVGPDGCKSNWNNMSMMMAGIYTLIWFDNNPNTRLLYQLAMGRELMNADYSKALINNNNPWYNFMWASQKFLGPKSDGPAFEAVEAGVCALRQFPARKHPVTRDTFEKYPHDCDGRLDASLTNMPIPVSERCLGTFVWWGCPYKREKCAEDSATIYQPGDYLLPYWMARYFGFIGEND